MTTIFVWLAAILMFEGTRVWLAVSGPPATEEYIRRFDFQIFASAYLVATLWLPILGLALLLEYGVFGLSRRRLTKPVQPARPEGPRG